jgi:hypothetical protein
LLPLPLFFPRSPFQQQCIVAAAAKLPLRFSAAAAAALCCRCRCSFRGPPFSSSASLLPQQNCRCAFPLPLPLRFAAAAATNYCRCSCHEPQGYNSRARYDPGA